LTVLFGAQHSTIVIVKWVLNIAGGDVKPAK